MQTQSLSRSQVRSAHEVLTAELMRLKVSSPPVKRGGTHGTHATLKIMNALAEGGIAGYQALENGFQPSDIAVLTAQYPHALTIVSNFTEFQKEVTELDIEDGCEIGIQFLRIVKNLCSAQAAGQELPVRSSISPEAAYKAAEQTLHSTRDVIKIGLNVFAGGFNVLKLPELLSAFPQATLLANNAPIAVQSWGILTFDQQCDLLKVAIECIQDIVASLQTDVRQSLFRPIKQSLFRPIK